MQMVASFFRDIADTLTAALDAGRRKGAFRFYRRAFRMALRFTPAIHVPEDGETGAVTILCHDQVHLYIAAIKSFCYFSGIPVGVLVIDDGTLTAWDRAFLSYHVHGLSVVPYRTALRQSLAQLPKNRYPFCRRFRSEIGLEHSIHNGKLFDSVFSAPFKRIIILDSDVIFFHTPTEIVRWFKTGDDTTLHMAYERSIIDRENRWGLLGIKILSQLWGSPETLYYNSGIVCLTKKYFSIPDIEYYMKKYYGFTLKHEMISDQFFQSLMWHRIGKRGPRVSPLDPMRYSVLMSDRPRRNLFSNACIHYHAETKEFAERDIVQLLRKTRCFRIPLS